MTKAIITLVVGGITVAGFACTPAQQEVRAIPKPTFDYTPPTTAAPGNAQVSIALLAPQYPSEALWLEVAPDFPRTMHHDFQELLTARGFTVKGPYHSTDDMVYADKATSDVTLTPILEMNADISDLELSKTYKFRIGAPSGDVFKISTGQVALSGRVTLVVSEAMTGERLWSPSVELPANAARFVGTVEYTQPPPPISTEESELVAGVGRLMQQVYDQIMTECWDQLDPAQLQLLKKQSDEIKKKTGFVAK